MTGVGLALLAGIFLSYSVVKKWNQRPMFVSFDTVPTQIWDVPFPAVTVCNGFKANRKKVDFFSSPP